MAECSHQRQQRRASKEENELIDAMNQCICLNEAIEPPTPMFRLIIDCFDHIFMWLSLAELLVFRLTCKRMYAVVNQYIERNYPRLKSLEITEQQRWSEFCQMPLKSFKLITELHIEQLKLTHIEVDRITYILNKIERLFLKRVNIDGEFYELILKHCAQLNYLSIECCHYASETAIIGSDNAWLRRQYPALEHFGLIHGPDTLSYAELLEFFKRNPNLQSIALNSSFLLNNRDLILQSNWKFDNLLISIDHDWNVMYNKFVNDLYARGIYKMVFMVDSNYSIIEEFATISNLKMLNMMFTTNVDVPIPVVDSIETLFLGEMPDEGTTKMLVKNFLNLNAIYVYDVRNLGDLWPLVCHAPKLSAIRLLRFCGSCFNISDLIAMNAERQKLAGASKIGIFLNEKLYLKLKWKARTKFSMIEFMRN